MSREFNYDGALRKKLGLTPARAIKEAERIARKAVTENPDMATSESSVPRHQGSVWQDWVNALSWHDQRMIASSMRGMDQGAGGADATANVKMIVHCLRRETQRIDPDDKDSRHYLGLNKKTMEPEETADDVDIKEVRKELDHTSYHFVEHLLNAIYLCARERGNTHIGNWTKWYTYLRSKIALPLLNGHDGIVS